MTSECVEIVNWLKNWFTPKDEDYTYSISSSEYNPTIDSTITIYVKVTDGNGDGVANHTFTMKTKNGDVSLTTDSNGQATHSYTCNTWGNQRFRVNGYSMYLNVTGWRTITRTNYTLWINGAERLCEIRYYKSKVSVGTSWTFIETISDSDYVPAPQGDSVYCACNMRGMVVRIFSSGSIQAQATTATSNQLLSFHTMWHY